jgi:hypothetical protein
VPLLKGSTPLINPDTGKILHSTRYSDTLLIMLLKERRARQVSRAASSDAAGIDSVLRSMASDPDPPLMEGYDET